MTEKSKQANEAWNKFCETQKLKRVAEKFNFRRMNIQELHDWEDEAKRILEKLDPNHPVLKYYGSTYKAIEAYEGAIEEIKAQKTKSKETDQNG